MDLVAFLRARLDEDAALARGAEGGKGPHGYFAVTDWAYFDRDFGDLLPATRVNDSNAWSPARVLAEVEAKRALLDAMTGPALSVARAGTCDAGLATARFLALPYADHPDYQPEWKP